jgi:hypothetical protein
MKDKAAKITKLQNLARAEEAQGNDKAAATARELAERLRSRLADLVETPESDLNEAYERERPGSTDEEPDWEVEEAVVVPGRKALWRCFAAAAVAKHYGCVSIHAQDGSSITIYGRGSDVLRAEYQVHCVLRLFDQLAASERSVRRGDSGVVFLFEPRPWSRGGRADYLWSLIEELKEVFEDRRRERVGEINWVRGEGAGEAWLADWQERREHTRAWVAEHIDYEDDDGCPYWSDVRAVLDDDDLPLTEGIGV